MLEFVMGGSNPYINYPHIERPKKKYKIKFLPSNREIEVDPDKLPLGDTGLPGSVLDIALHNGIEIDHACGGVSACSTCHIFVKKGFDSCNPPEEFEFDMLDTAPGNTVESRLSCQCVANGTEDITVEIPEWNRHLTKEDH